MKILNCRLFFLLFFVQTFIFSGSPFSNMPYQPGVDTCTSYGSCPLILPEGYPNTNTFCQDFATLTMQIYEFNQTLIVTKYNFSSPFFSTEINNLLNNASALDAAISNLVNQSNVAVSQIKSWMSPLLSASTSFPLSLYVLLGSCFFHNGSPLSNQDIAYAQNFSWNGGTTAVGLSNIPTNSTDTPNGANVRLAASTCLCSSIANGSYLPQIGEINSVLSAVNNNVSFTALAKQLQAQQQAQQSHLQTAKIN